ncbi:Ig-like domain-containing protein [Carnobacterium gallinarum]|uniref:Ig-like domain-containing protein n=1 Tax=Carnobacterium gallinarum TaxID=2749 RepID=UPI00068A5CFC|nr:Ig-like domain-containing protein [Carnobacterium gallinarum]
MRIEKISSRVLICGLVLGCGLIFDSSIGSASQVTSGKLLENRLETVLSAKSLNKAQLESFYHTGYADANPMADYVVAGYPTNQTTTIQMQRVQNYNRYVLIDGEFGGVGEVAVGEVVGETVTFKNFQLKANNHYSVFADNQEHVLFFETGGYNNTNPVISVIPVIRIPLGGDFNPLDNVTAWDKEDGFLTSKINVTKNTVDVNTVGTYEVDYEVYDSDGGRGTASARVIVFDDGSSNQAPVIEASDQTINVGDIFKPLEKVKATDPEDGDITSKVEVKTNEVDNSKAGKCRVSYYVEDSKGKSATKDITVTVIENTSIPAPVLNPVFTTDTTVQGIGAKNSTLYLTMGADKYQEDIGATGVFKVTLDANYASGTQITAYTQDAAGNKSLVYTGVVVKNELTAPVLNKVTEKDTSITGKAPANTTLYLQIGSDKYEEDVNSNGVFSMALDNSYPIGTKITAYVKDSNGQQSDVATYEVEAAEDIYLEKFTSGDIWLKGKTFANAVISAKVDNYRARVYEGEADSNGNFAIEFSRNYPAGATIEVTATDPLTGVSSVKTVQIYPKAPTIYTIQSGDTKISGIADPNAQVFVQVNNEIFEGTADEAGSYTVKVATVPLYAAIAVYQVVNNIHSEKTEITVEQ